MAALFTSHPLVLQAAYSDLKQRARERRTLLIGTPGSVSVREVRDGRFLYRQFYDHAGKKRADYLGPADDPAASGRADEVRAAIGVTNDLLASARLLARAGYVRVDGQTSAAVSACARHGLFVGGAVLVGSHAYGALVNELGVRAAAFRTLDLDLARDRRLGVQVSLESVLAETFVDFTPVLGFDRKVPSTSFKAPGREGLRIDLLVPTSGDDITVRPVPELAAHATALPHLRYLITSPIDSIVIGREGIAPVRIPSPERFAWHKMLVSQLRTATSDKRTKDLHQAAVVVAALAEQDAEALRDAFAECPQKTRVRAAARLVDPLLAAHERARETLREIAEIVTY